MKIRDIRLEDASAWEAMRCDMWPDGVDDHSVEIAAFFGGTLKEPSCVLVAEDDSGIIVAIAELSIRCDLAGLPGKKTGYVEGLFVKSECRGRGYARALLMASREWARRSKCDAFASDRAGRVIIDERFLK